MPSAYPSQTDSIQAAVSTGASAALGPGVAGGFRLAAIVWVVWFVTHLPWLSEAFGLGEQHSIPAIIVAWLLGACLLGRSVSLRLAPTAGLLAGLISALVGLLILGSRLTEVPVVAEATDSPTPMVASQLVPNAGLIALGFIGLGAFVGVVGTSLGALTRPKGPTQPPDWLARMALTTVLVAAPLLFVGGLVTSTNSGMAVPDWPGTYGSNMFLYPLGPRFAALEGKEPYVDIFLEHSHRLFGAMLGLTALVLMAWVLVREPRRWVKLWSVGVFVLICGQGALGGLRVLEGSLDLAQDNVWLSAFHGVSAQLVFASIVALAVYLSPTYRSLTALDAPAKARLLKGLSTGAMHALWPQLVFGAMYRHAGSPHALYTHIAFSFIVTGLAAVAGMLAASAPAGDQPSGTSPASKDGASRGSLALANLGYGVVLCVGLQFLLGWAAFAVHQGREAASIVEALVRTSHQANGAMLLGLTTALALMARQAWRVRGRVADVGMQQSGAMASTVTA
jgi:cytochrome c oxidase assembly protein subunit 15